MNLNHCHRKLDFNQTRFTVDKRNRFTVCVNGASKKKKKKAYLNIYFSETPHAWFIFNF